MITAVKTILGALLCVSSISAQESEPSFFMRLSASFRQEDAPTIAELAGSVDDLSTLNSLVAAAGLAETLASAGPFTVFAPSNDAFAAVPESLLNKLTSADFAPHLTDVLLFHVLIGNAIRAADISDGTTVTMANSEMVTLNVDSSSGAVTVSPALGGSATVVMADVGASNGVAHVIDAVLTPPSVTRNVVDIVTTLPGFTTLTSLLQMTDYIPVLTADDAAFTVFAPTDDAFAAAFEALGDEAVTFLTSDAGMDALATILGYHVVPGVVTAEQILSGSVPEMVGTVAEFDVSIMVDGSTVRVDDATVVTPNVLHTGGVVHAIDSVLLPPIDLAALIADGGNAMSSPSMAPTMDPSGPGGKFEFFSWLSSCIDRVGNYVYSVTRHH